VLLYEDSFTIMCRLSLLSITLTNRRDRRPWIYEHSILRTAVIHTHLSQQETSVRTNEQFNNHRHAKKEAFFSVALPGVPLVLTAISLGGKLHLHPYREVSKYCYYKNISLCIKSYTFRSNRAYLTNQNRQQNK
jgi:hypothetical protein